MPEPIIAVSGATGHIGSELCKALLAGGVKVRALGREAARLKAIGPVEPALGSLDDAMYLKKALSGVAAVFAMIPPNMASTDFRGYQRRIVRSWVEALQASSATHVVALSSIGADLPEGTGPIAGLHEMEQQLAPLKANVLFLRPTYFLENHFAGIGMIKGMGLYGSPLRPDMAIPQIATRDIAAVAAKRLIARDFTGKSVLELLGAKDYAMNDVARTLGKEINKPDLGYAQFPYEDAEKAMVGAGLSADMARLYIEMTRAFNDGRIKATQGRSPTTTTPTTLGQFAKQFAAAYKAAG
jgi:uncharacterized protein YbjT (DUF2867 family)